MPAPMRLSRLAFFVALSLLAFVAGDATDGGKRLWTLAAGAWQSETSRLRLRGGLVEVAASDAAAWRVQLLAPALAGPVLVAGGRQRFPGRCPGFVGCLAVEYDRHGRIVHAYPFRPEAYEAVLVHHGLAQPVGYERVVGFEFAEHADVFSVDGYSNGDLAVVLHSPLSSPAGLGIARVDRNGQPRWFRADGSHASAIVAHGRLRGVGSGLPDAVVVPGRRLVLGPPPKLSEDQWEVALGWAGCTKHFVDHLHVIDGDGVLLRQVAVADALRNSRHAPLEAYTVNDCNPLQISSVAVLSADEPSGLAAGDFLVSLRGLGALAALDGQDDRLGRIWRGSFFGQHGARELVGPTGPALLLFDGWGGGGEFGPGRLLALDVRSGVERTIYPNASSSAVGLRSSARGGVSVAPDGSRAIVHGSEQAVEIDLATGEATAVFQVLDNSAPAAGEPGQAYQPRTMDVRYAPAR